MGSSEGCASNLKSHGPCFKDPLASTLSVLRSGEHPGANFLFVVESEDEIGKAFPCQSAVRTRLSLYRPANSE